MGLLITATLASALAALLGGILMIRYRAASTGDELPPGRAAGNDAASRDVSGIAGLKAVIRSGDWRRALPSLLVLGGLLGIMLFGSLALIFDFDQSRSGWPMFALAALTIAWAVREYVRA